MAKIVEDYQKHYYFIGRILGKALYENLLVELPLAEFFLSKLAGKHSDVDVHQLVKYRFWAHSKCIHQYFANAKIFCFTTLGIAGPSSSPKPIIIESLRGRCGGTGLGFYSGHK